MHFTLSLNCNGAAFTVESNDEHHGEPNPGPEVASILRRLADRLDGPFAPVEVGDAFPLMDVNGNRVGTAGLTDDD